MDKREILELLEEMIHHCENCDSDGTAEEFLTPEEATELRRFLESVK